MRSYDLTDFQWRVISPLLLNMPRGVPRVDNRRVLNGFFWVCVWVRRGVTCPSTMGQERRATPFRALATGGRMEPADGHDHRGMRRRYPDDRQHIDMGAPAG